MKIVLKNRLIVGTAVLTLATGGLYGCKDFLNGERYTARSTGPETLANKAGVEGTLVGAYRTLDCTPALSSNWGCAASNWVLGGVVADDAYKGSDSGDQPPINDLEGYNWGTGNAELYLNVKWRTVYEGVVRANSALRLLKAVRAASPSEFSTVEANGVAGEAIFLRAHYHFEAWRMWGNIPYYREDDTDFRKPNEASAAVVTDILKDLDSAREAVGGDSEKQPGGAAFVVDGQGIQGTRSGLRGPIRRRHHHVVGRPAPTGLMHWNRASIKSGRAFRPMPTERKRYGRIRRQRMTASPTARMPTSANG